MDVKAPWPAESALDMSLTIWGPFLLTRLSWAVQWQCGTRPRLGWLLCYGANFAWVAYAGLSDQPGFLVRRADR